MSGPAVYLGFAAEVGELFAKGKAAGLSHEQLIKICEVQLDFERRLLKSHEADRRMYG